MAELTWIKTVVALVGGWMSWYLGGVNNILAILLTLVIIDYLTGIFSAAINKDICSQIGMKVIIQKILIFVLIGVANLVDTSIFQNAIPLKESVIFFYIANEAISITENAAKIGLPLPKKLRNILKYFKDD